MLINFLFFITLLLTIFTKFSNNLSLKIFLLAVVTGLLYYDNKKSLFYDVFYVILDRKVVELSVVIVLIYFFSNIIKESNRLALITRALQIIFSDNRLILIFMPALIGLIPMPGGAMFTAPITEEVGNKANISQEDKTFTNYWFRHCWELAFPLYPGIILASGLINQSPNELAYKLFPLCVTAFIVGLILFYIRTKNNNSVFSKITKDDISNREIHFQNSCNGSDKLSFYYSLLSLWPIIYVVIIALLKISLIKGLLILNFIMIFVDKISLSASIRCFRNAVNLNVIFIIWSVFFFGKVLNNSGILLNITEYLINYGISIVFISFILPFIVGITTGVTTAFVGVIFPILLPLWKGLELEWTQFAYASGLAGVFLSPAHLCFSLTNEYFGSDLLKVIKLVLIPTILIVLHSFVNLYIH